MNTTMILVGAGLLGAWYFTRSCCDFVPTLAVDRPIRPPGEEETNRRRYPPSSENMAFIFAIHNHTTILATKFA